MSLGRQMFGIGGKTGWQMELLSSKTADLRLPDSSLNNTASYKLGIIILLTNEAPIIL